MAKILKKHQKKIDNITNIKKKKHDVDEKLDINDYSDNNNFDNENENKTKDDVDDDNNKDNIKNVKDKKNEIKIKIEKTKINPQAKNEKDDDGLDFASQLHNMRNKHR